MAEHREYRDFSGGVNEQIGPIVSENSGQEAFYFAEAALNIEMSEAGLIKFAGFDNVLNAALSGTPIVTGLFEFNKNGTLELIACADGNVFRIAGGVATQIYTGHTAGKFYQGVVFNDVLILCNGTDTPLAYDGTSCTTITFSDPQSIWSNAKPKGAAVFRNRIFYWGDSTFGHRIYTPRPGTYNNFDNNENTVDAFDVDKGYGGKITGLKPLTDDMLVIYKERVIRRLSGSAPFNSGGDQFLIGAVTDEIGCVAPRSLVQVGLEHYFLGQNGLRQLKPINSYGDVQPLQPTYPIQSKMNLLNYTPGIIDQACAIFHQPDNKIYLSVPTGSSTTNNEVFVFDVITKTNEPRGTGISAASIGVYNRKIHHGTYSGQVYLHGSVFHYDGLPIESYWKSKWVAHQGIGTYKRYSRLVIFAEGEGNTDIIIRWGVLQRGQSHMQNNTQGIYGGTLWDNALWDQALWAAGDQSVFELKNLGRGKAFKLEFLNTSGSQRPKIRQIDLYFEVFGTSQG